MQIVSFRAAEDALRFIGSAPLFALGAAARSCLQLRHYTKQYLSRVPQPAWSNNAPSKRALVTIGAAVCVISFCLTLVLLPG
jgi:hypothetical protein